jgi:hypothetical protein
MNNKWLWIITCVEIVFRIITDLHQHETSFHVSIKLTSLAVGRSSIVSGKRLNHFFKNNSQNSIGINCRSIDSIPFS